jgi:hypothetical protein
MLRNTQLTDLRYPGIQWTTRASGETSVGQTIADPRTGEILHGLVRLDSAHFRRASLGGLGVVAPGSGCGPGSVALLSPLRFAGLNQDHLAYIAAHEVGHVLGLAHNMAASTYGGSVMDYLPADIRGQGAGVEAGLMLPAEPGVYDELAIRWGYTPGVTPQDLEAMIREGLGRGVVYPGEGDWRWAEWDGGNDPVEGLARQMALRSQLLNSLAPCQLAEGASLEELSERATEVYFRHGSAAHAVAAQVGGAAITRAVHGDGQRPFEWLSPETQRRALKALLSTLSAENLEWPASLEPFLPGVAPSAVAQATLLARTLLSPLLDSPERLNRLAEGAGGLTLGEVLDELVRATWEQAPSADPRRRTIEQAVGQAVLEALIAILQGSPTETLTDSVILDRLERLREDVSRMPPPDASTRAHLARARWRLAQVLDVGRVH